MKKALHTSVTLLLLAVILSFGGCKKSSAPNGLVASQSQSNTVNGVTSNQTITYTYDNQSRLVEIQYSSGSPVSVSYGSGSVTVTSGTNVTIYTLNSAGLATSDNQGNTYAYNSSGYCTAVTNTNGTSSTVSTVENNNVVTQAVTNAGTTTTYSYTFLTTTDYRSYGINFLGKNSVNLVNTLTSSVGTNNTTVSTYTYTFDSQGRVQTQNLSSAANSSVYTFTYTN